jgi:hypothetical protein
MRSRCGTIDEDGSNARGEGTGDDRESILLRGSSIAVLGARAEPHSASGPCGRGVARTVERFEKAGYAGVVAGGVVPPLPTKASSFSPMGSILLSGAGGGMPGLAGGAYVVRGALEMAAVRLGGVYASFESGLEPGALPLGTSVREVRNERERRGDRRTWGDGGLRTGLCWPC